MAFQLADLVAPPRTALLIQELQNGVVGPESKLPDVASMIEEAGIVARAAELAKKSRDVGVSVVHCTVERLPEGFGLNTNARLFVMAKKTQVRPLGGTHAALPVDNIGVGSSDIVLPRYAGLSPMTGTPLDTLLRNQGISTVVVVGVSLNLAIPNLVFDAANRGYQVVVVRDAVAGSPREYAEQVLEHSLSRVSTLVTTEDLLSVWTPTA